MQSTGVCLRTSGRGGFLVCPSCCPSLLTPNSGWRLLGGHCWPFHHPFASGINRAFVSFGRLHRDRFYWIREAFMRWFYKSRRRGFHKSRKSKLGTPLTCHLVTGALLTSSHGSSHSTVVTISVTCSSSVQKHFSHLLPFLNLNSPMNPNPKENKRIIHFSGYIGDKWTSPIIKKWNNKTKQTSQSKTKQKKQVNKLSLPRKTLSDFFVMLCYLWL